MKSLSEIQSKLTQAKPYLTDKYHVTQLGIFGSYVRQEQTAKSDIDILIDFEPNFRFGLITFCELEDYLSTLLGEKVDLVMRDGLKPRISQRILSEVVYL